MNEWLARIRSLISNCDYENDLDTRIVDRCVLGMGPGPIGDRLFEEDANKLITDRALALATAKQASAEQYSFEPNRSIKKEPVNFVKSKQAGCFQNTSPRKQIHSGSDSSMA